MRYLSKIPSSSSTMILKQSLLYSLFILLLITSSCASDDSPETDSGTFFQEAKLNDFLLSETTYLSIDITHPEINDGVETKPGKIRITIPFSQTSLTLSLREFNLDQNKYNISPLVGEPVDFSKGVVTYTIRDVFSQNRSVRYEVTVEQGGDPFFVNAKITGFKFEKAKNPELNATIEAVKIAEYTNYSENAIYVIVPEGTDFSELTPTITYDAAKIYYNTENQFVLYPANGLTVNFSYPRYFYLQAENSQGTRSKSYRVIVDVANPIEMTSPITTADVKAGDGIATENFFAIATWTNRGNHPITGMSPSSYKDKVYPIPNYPGDANIIVASLQNPIGGTAGVLPGEQGEINVRVKRSPVTGIYATTAVFAPTFSFDTRIISYWPVDDRVEGIFQPQQVVIQTTIEE